MSSYVFMRVLESVPERYDLGMRILSRGRIEDVYRHVARIAAVPGSRVLDIGCGTGGVALSCAEAGAVVTGIDINAGMLEVARRKPVPVETGGSVEWVELGAVEIEDRFPELTFDAVVSCDNAVPHLMTDNDLCQAMSSMLSQLRSGGLLLIGVRDYDQMADKRPKTTPIRSFGIPPNRRIVFQTWEWAEDGSLYDFDHFLLTETPDGWVTHHGRNRYRAWSRAELESAAAGAGFTQPIWHGSPGDLRVTLTALAP